MSMNADALFPVESLIIIILPDSKNYESIVMDSHFLNMEKELQKLLRHVKNALTFEGVLVVEESSKTSLAWTEWDPFVITFEVTSCNPTYILNMLLARSPTFVTNLCVGPSPAGPNYRQLSVDMK
jgi:hypothetical protein